MSNDRKSNTLVPIYKNKGDFQYCSNYQGIKLMSHTIKLWDRLIEINMRCTSISKKTNLDLCKRIYNGSNSTYETNGVL